MGKVILITRQDEHKDYDLEFMESYCARLQKEGRKFTRVDGIVRKDGHTQTELTMNG